MSTARRRRPAARKPGGKGMSFDQMVGAVACYGLIALILWGVFH